MSTPKLCVGCHNAIGTTLAHKMEAAEELYAALNKIAYAPFGDSEASDREVLEEITHFARAALAKAEGSK